MKPWLSIVGLLFDLSGAFLLSVPLLWNPRQASRRIYRAIARWRRYVLRRSQAKSEATSQIATHTDRLSKEERLAVIEAYRRIISLGAAMAMLFMILIARMFFLVTEYSGEYLLLKDFVSNYYYVFLLIAFLIVLTYAMFFASFIPIYTGRFLWWVAKEKQERRIGIIGLILLSIGFIIQAIVNLL